MSSFEGSFRIVDPIFWQSGTTVHIGFPTANSNYALYSGTTDTNGEGTGISNNDPLVWSLEVGKDFALGNEQGEKLTENLQTAISNYTVIAIRMYFNNGDVAILYRDHINDWRIKPRRVGLSSINPTITYDGDTTTFTFRSESTDYRFVYYNGGNGESDGESTTWDYSYYVRR